MNGRAVRKRLMRCRVQSLFGERAFLCVRVPITVYPEPSPVIPSFPGEELYGGHWSLEKEDGSHDEVVISNPSSGMDPHEFDGPETLRFVEKTPYYWQWWTGWKYSIPAGATREETWECFHRGEDLPIEVVEQYRRVCGWEYTFVHGYPRAPYEAHEGWRNDARWAVASALLDAGTHAKTVYPHVDGEFMTLTFSVKWRYPQRVRRFSAAMHRVFDLARKRGVAVKVLRVCP